MPQTLTRPDVTIRYWTAGDPDASTVVFTHGATLHHAAFASQFRTVLDAGYRVVAWDLRGHGASQPLAGEEGAGAVDGPLGPRRTVGQRRGADEHQPVMRLWPEAHLRRMLPRFMSQRPEVRDYVAEAFLRRHAPDHVVRRTESVRPAGAVTSLE